MSNSKLLRWALPALVACSVSSANHAGATVILDSVARDIGATPSPYSPDHSTTGGPYNQSQSSFTTLIPGQAGTQVSAVLSGTIHETSTGLIAAADQLQALARANGGTADAPTDAQASASLFATFRVTDADSPYTFNANPYLGAVGAGDTNQINASAYAHLRNVTAGTDIFNLDYNLANPVGQPVLLSGTLPVGTYEYTIGASANVHSFGLSTQRPGASDGFSFTVLSITPEPASLSMLALALPLLGRASRCRNA